MDYIISLLDIPGRFYFIAGMLFVSMLTLCIWQYSRHRKNYTELLMLAFLLPYLYVVLAITLLSREPYEGMHYQLRLFWSYQAYWEGQTSLLEENILNVFMLLPLGILLPCYGQFFDLKRTTMAGLGCSFMIELLQGVTQRGLFEFDDMFHNTLGVVIGYGAYVIMRNRRLLAADHRTAAAYERTDRKG